MVNGLWGKKVGMTQVFQNSRVVPVTVVDVSHWRITQIKTIEKDGYNALQLGLVRAKYRDHEFTKDWLSKLSRYFCVIKEVKHTDAEEFEIGQLIDFEGILKQGDFVDAFGVSKGHGFQGVVKRYGWSGGKASHGSKFGRQPGALGGPRESGDVPKGKGLPGHMGASRRMSQNLEIIELFQEGIPIVLVKGSIPGKLGSLVFLRKRG